MALSAAIVWEVEIADTHADDANGGGFKTGATGTDYTQGVGLGHIDIADLETDGANLNVMVSAGRNFVAADVGNVIHVISGTHATAGWYEIISVAADKATVDRNWATEDNSDHDDGVAILGGALATPGGLGAVLAAHAVDGMKAYGKGGTYTLTNAVPNTSGGPFAPLTGINLLIEGYETSRGDLGTPPVFDAGAQTSITLVTTTGGSGGQVHFVNWVLDGNSGADNNGFDGSGASYGADRVYRVWARDCPGIGLNINALAVQIKATGCGTGICCAAQLACLVGPIADGNTVGIDVAGSYVCIVRPVIINNTANGLECGTSHGVVVVDPTVYNNGADGIDMGSRLTGSVVGGVFTENDAYGINNPNAFNFILQVAGVNNTSGFIKTATARDFGQITLTGDPFIDAAGDDFRPDDTAGQGASLRGEGVGPWEQTNNIDIGAVQHTDPAGGGGGGVRNPLGGPVG